MVDTLLVEAQRVERAIARVRWGAAALAGILGPTFPNLYLPGVFALTGYIAAYNVATLWASARAPTLEQHRRVAALAFLGDLLALSVAMLLFSSDVFWTTYVLGTLVITSAAFRFGTVGTVVSTAFLSAAYVGVALFRQAAFNFAVTPERALFNVSVYVLTAILLDRILIDIASMRSERERLIRRLERRLAEDAALATAMRIVASVPASQDVVPAVLRASREVFRFDRATVFVPDELLGEYRILHRLQSEGDPAPPPRPHFKLGEGLVAVGLASDRPLLIPDVLADPRYTERGVAERPRSVILVPLKVGGRAVAVFSLSRALPDVFGPDDLRLAETIASLIAQVLENERLFAEASEAQALREIDRLKDEFLAAVSHELRTPLTVISGAVELLAQRRDGLDERAQRLVDQAARNVKRLQRDVTDLLDLAQLQEAKIALNREFVDAGALLAEAAAASDDVAAQRAQRIEVSGDVSLPVLADRRRMLQILGNLITNASRYSPEGSTILLRAEREGDEVRIAVIDEGPGVPAAERLRVFDKFYRAAGGREVVGGIGLGLSIAKMLVELHGGRVWVEEREGAPGSAFVVSLPYEPSPVPAAVGA